MTLLDIILRRKKVVVRIPNPRCLHTVDNGRVFLHFLDGHFGEGWWTQRGYTPTKDHCVITRNMLHFRQFLRYLQSK